MSPGLPRTSWPPCFNPAAHGDQTGHHNRAHPPSGPDRLHAAASEPDLQIFTELPNKLVQPYEDFFFNLVYLGSGDHVTATSVHLHNRSNEFHPGPSSLLFPSSHA